MADMEIRVHPDTGHISAEEISCSDVHRRAHVQAAVEKLSADAFMAGVDFKATREAGEAVRQEVLRELRTLLREFETARITCQNYYGSAGYNGDNEDA